MNPVIRSHALELIGTGASFVGAITSRMEDFEYWLRNLGLAVALAAGVLTSLSILRKEYPHLLPKFLRPKPPAPPAPDRQNESA